MLVGAYDAAVAWHVRAGALGLVAGEVAVGRREEQHVAVRNVPLQPGDPSHCTWGVERRAEFSALGPGAAVSWPWVPAWGSLEPSRPGDESAQTTRKNGEKMGEI